MLMLMVKNDDVKIIKYFKYKGISYFITKIYYRLLGYEVYVID